MKLLMPLLEWSIPLVIAVFSTAERLSIRLKYPLPVRSQLACADDVSANRKKKRSKYWQHFSFQLRELSVPSVAT